MAGDLLRQSSTNFNSSGIETITAASTVAPLAGAAERVLADAAERALRYPQDKVVFVLHLSRLAPPAPRAHHLRVARVLMQDCAQRFGGQVFVLQTQDLVLLCTVSHNAPQTQADSAHSPAQLKTTLARLFVADVPDPARLTSLWRLDEDATPFRTYLAGTLAAFIAGHREAAPAPEDIPTSALSLAALEEIAAQAPLADLMVQQTGMVLDPNRKLSLAQRLKPAFRQLGVSLAPLNLRPVVTEALADPYLQHHFATRLDARMLQILHDDLHAKGRLTRASLRGGLPIHIGLSLEAILTPRFARMSRLARDAGARFAIEITLMQASVEIDLLEHVRSLLALARFDLAIGPLDAAGLSLTLPGALRPDAIKIAWSPPLGEASADPSSALQKHLARSGPEKIILQNVDSEHAIAWGQAHGITRFQGPFLDTVQAATRMAGCHAAGACTLRQCTSRASAQGGIARTGCANPALLDASVVAV